jgi:hypothetical protein
MAMNWGMVQSIFGEFDMNWGNLKDLPKHLTTISCTVSKNPTGGPLNVRFVGYIFHFGGLSPVLG